MTQRLQYCAATSAWATIRCRIRTWLEPSSKEAFSQLAFEVARRAPLDSSRELLYATALMELGSASTDSAGPRRAVALLERLVHRFPEDIELRNDLVVAHLEAAERQEDLGELLRALDRIATLTDDPSIAEVRFNRAIVLQRLGLSASARKAWSEVLATERDSTWLREARARIRQLELAGDTLTPRDFPQRARDQVFARLGAWARAHVTGDTAARERELERMREAGDSLGRLQADRSVSLIVDWLKALRPPYLKLAARGLASFSEGVQFEQAGEYERSLGALTRAEILLSQLASPAALWASQSIAAAQINLTRYGDADTRLARLVKTAPATMPALKGRALWLLATIRLRRGEFERAIEGYHSARPYFVVARDARNEAAISFLLTEALQLAGTVKESFPEALKGLRTLSPYRTSLHLHSQLVAVADLARRSGLKRASIALLSEAIEVDRGLPRLDALVASLCARASDHAALGDTSQALVDLGSAGSASRSLSGFSSELARASIALTRGRVLSAFAPDEAFGALTEAAASYRSLGVWGYELAARSEIARSALQQGRRVEAESHLRYAAGLVARVQGTYQSVASRSAFHETAEGVYDALSSLALDRRDAAGALDYLEAQREAVWTKRPGPLTSRAARGSLRRVAAHLPRDVIFIAYGVFPEELIAWYAGPARSGFQRAQISRDSLVALLGVPDIPQHPSSRAPRQATERLFDLLLRPILEIAGPASQLIIVPDRELTAAPFAALRDAATGRYIIQTHSIRIHPSAAFTAAVLSLDARLPPSQSALVVGDPALPSDSRIALPSLAGASREAQTVGSLYVGSRVILGEGASKGAVLRALETATGVFHFAGHAVFNEERPASSYLALAARVPGAESRLEAWEITRLRLSKLRLVVLSGCSTLRSRFSRTGAAAGIAFSFLYAGVPATLSTNAEIGDTEAVDIVIAFHRYLQSGLPSHRALQRAQIDAASQERASSISNAWARFVYTGP